MNDFIVTDFLKRMCDYWKDKKLAEKCGLDVRDICEHENDGLIYTSNPPQSKCKKCGGFFCE